MTHLRTGLLSVAIVGLLALPPVGAQAQIRWNVEGRGGFSVPSGNTADHADVGGAFGLGAGLWVRPKIGVRVDAIWERFGEQVSGGPLPIDTESARLLVGVERHLLEPGLFPVSAIVSAHVGWTRVEARIGSGGAPLKDDALTLGAGLSVGYDVLVGLNVFLKGEALVGYADGLSIQSGTAPGGQPLDVDLFGTMVSFPVTAGIRLDLFSR